MSNAIAIMRNPERFEAGLVEPLVQVGLTGLLLGKRKKRDRKPIVREPHIAEYQESGHWGRGGE